MASPKLDEAARHLNWFEETTTSAGDARLEETKTTPLFSHKVAATISNGQTDLNLEKENSIFPQYGLLGKRQATYEGATETEESNSADNLIYANVNAPWSTFICGSQGGGKSHTMSCLLENALQQNSGAGLLPNPLSGIIFHYDAFTGVTSHQVCEAAYLCSAGIPVRVLVSPSNRFAMENIYTNLPGLTGPAPEVIPLYLSERQLNISNMITLMNVDQTSAHTPLYLEVLFRILREMAEESQGRPGLDYSDFVRRLEAENFSREQSTFLNLRLRLLESFMVPKAPAGATKLERPDPWDFCPGTLTIVDLSDPFVSSNDACALFSICLSIFLGRRNQGGCIVALDEAHKFLTSSSAALEFTNVLTSVIAQQRHIATRVVIATQEPTLSPRLLDMCNVTIVHRFLSPAWFETLRSHLAGAGLTDKNVMHIFNTIVGLKTGQALLFSPTAILDITSPPAAGLTDTKADLIELKAKYIRIRIRKRITADGGKSLLAYDQDKPTPPSDFTPGPSSGDYTDSTGGENSLSTSPTEPKFNHPPSVTYGQRHTPSSPSQARVQPNEPNPEGKGLAFRDAGRVSNVPQTKGKTAITKGSHQSSQQRSPNDKDAEWKAKMLLQDEEHQIQALQSLQEELRLTKLHPEDNIGHHKVQRRQQTKERWQWLKGKREESNKQRRKKASS